MCLFVNLMWTTSCEAVPVTALAGGRVHANFRENEPSCLLYFLTKCCKWKSKLSCTRSKLSSLLPADPTRHSNITRGGKLLLCRKETTCMLTFRHSASPVKLRTATTLPYLVSVVAQRRRARFWFGGLKDKAKHTPRCVWAWIQCIFAWSIHVKEVQYVAVPLTYAVHEQFRRHTAPACRRAPCGAAWRRRTRRCRGGRRQEQIGRLLVSHTPLGRHGVSHWSAGAYRYRFHALVDRCSRPCLLVGKKRSRPSVQERQSAIRGDKTWSQGRILVEATAAMGSQIRGSFPCAP
jgi:hypothetical protein